MISIIYYKKIRQLTKQFDDLYKHLMGENRDLNDPMFIYMNNLKVQINKFREMRIIQTTVLEKYLKLNKIKRINMILLRYKNKNWMKDSRFYLT